MVATLEQVFRAEWCRVLATLIGFLGDFGRPRNRATDRIRRDRALAAKFGLLVASNRSEVPMKTTTFPDERLELKRKIKAAGIPFRVPPVHLLRERLGKAVA